MNKLTKTTTNETNRIHWAEIDGIKYGIYDSFDPDTLMVADLQWNVDNCDRSERAANEKIAGQIHDLVAEEEDV